MGKISKSHTTPYFEKQFRKLPKFLQKIAKRKILLFEKNPSHPSLHTHKLKGELSAYWSFYINDAYRVLFRFINGDEIVYYDIDTHGIYK